MPTYVYNILDSNGNGTEHFFEIKQSIHDDALTNDPETGEPCVRVPQLPMILIDLEKPKSIGGIAEKNTQRMIKEGDSRIKKAKDEKTPWWRDKGQKPLNTSNWNSKQIQRYIYEGKKPS